MDQSISKILKVAYRNRWAAAGAFLSVFGGLLIYILITPRMYSAKVRLMLDEKPATSISPLGRDLAQPPGNSNKALATQEELVRSKKVLSKAIALYQQSTDNNLAEEITFGAVKNELETQVVPGTQIIEISLNHVDPSTTAALLNLIATGVVEENAETIRSEARATRQFLEKQIPHRQQQLVSIEAAISQFKQKYNIVSLGDTDNKRLTQSIADAEKVAEDISAQIRQTQARNIALSQVTGRSTPQATYESTKAGQDPELISLRSKLADLESQLNLKRESLTEEHPDIQKLLNERSAAQILYQEKLSSLSDNQSGTQNPNEVAADKVTQELSEKLILSDVEQKELRQKLLSTEAYISSLNDRRQQFPVLEKTLASLTRQMETATQSVKLLKQKLDEARIAEAQLVSNLRIIEEATKPSLPTSPNVPSLLLLGTVAAFAFSVGIILLIEGLDGRLRDLEDLEAFTELPLLGSIPKQRNGIFRSTPSADLCSDPALLETFRLLSKNVQHQINRESNVLIITSAISGEGKSYVASNLAVVSAMLSKKTLLVDADIFRPSIHSIFQSPLEPGLLDILNSNSASEEESASLAIQRTSVRNLSVMTAGKPSQDRLFPFELENENVSSLLEKLSRNYELVIVDTPPVMSCADALTLCHGHQAVMVAKLDLTPKSILKKAIDTFNSNNAKLIGLAINGDASKNNDYYQYLQKDYALAS
ncbi:P-loop NTPase [Acaryochloris sp. IP29b_bin.148]|uniref:GumC family protein n=1 Tax=Acaryochloris sp. IP29b_bin.148 TaxID=2969218 RepID=UPI00260C41BC|nr:P-loop NTPase [Acaryochloris sp. IP29b_bin.148]